jgi:hypothetical protein
LVLLDPQAVSHRMEPHPSECQMVSHLGYLKVLEMAYRNPGPQVGCHFEDLAGMAFAQPVWRSAPEGGLGH